FWVFFSTGRGSVGPSRGRHRRIRRIYCSRSIRVGSSGMAGGLSWVTAHPACVTDRPLHPSNLIHARGSERSIRCLGSAALIAIPVPVRQLTLRKVTWQRTSCCHEWTLPRSQSSKNAEIRVRETLRRDDLAWKPDEAAVRTVRG